MDQPTSNGEPEGGAESGPPPARKSRRAPLEDRSAAGQSRGSTKPAQAAAGVEPQPLQADSGPSRHGADRAGSAEAPAARPGFRSAGAPPASPRDSEAESGRSGPASAWARRRASEVFDDDARPVPVELPFDQDDEEFGRELEQGSAGGEDQKSAWRRRREEAQAERPRSRWREKFAREPGPAAAQNRETKRESAPRKSLPPESPPAPLPEEPQVPAELDRRAKARLAAASLGGGRAEKKSWRQKSGPGKPVAQFDRGPETDRSSRQKDLCEGMLFIDFGGHGKLRQKQHGYRPDKDDVHLSPRIIEKCGLRQGSIVRGRQMKGMGKHKWDLAEALEVDGKGVEDARRLPEFRRLTSIDPDFHYALGDLTDDVSLRVIDLLCPIGRGSRGLIVAPPRTGKTILMQKIAKGIEEHYPEVTLMVLLVDERPEEATEWKRATKGEVFVSTNDEMPRVHVELAEIVWARCTRLVELGKDVILLLDSITRLARAYNNTAGNSGKTMSGGLDSRAMERPKQFFGSARNTESAGSLTILGTTLIETGSLMDKLIFEEFKGTGNMEMVLSRKLADRRIFPALDVERSGTRKEEKLMSAQRLKRVTTLRRVLARMNFVEAMELLINRLEEVERNDDFLKRFETDPEA